MIRMRVWATATAAFFFARGFAVPAEAADQAVELGAGPGLRPRAGPGALDQHAGQVLVAVTGPGRPPPAAGLVVRGCEPGPGGQVITVGEERHIGADLGNDHGSGDRADAGDGHQQVPLGAKGNQHHLRQAIGEGLSPPLRSQRLTAQPFRLTDSAARKGGPYRDSEMRFISTR
jgi:hypothetical protein